MLSFSALSLLSNDTVPSRLDMLDWLSVVVCSLYLNEVHAKMAFLVEPDASRLQLYLSLSRIRALDLQGLTVDIRLEKMENGPC